jgi:hypothetical protein
MGEEMLERSVSFQAAYDKTDPNPSKSYGVHGVNILFLVKGKHGAIQFLLYTNWHLPHVQAHMDAKTPSGDFPYMFHKPMPADIGYHSRVPQYEGQEPMTDECEHLNGEKCYYDGSSLQAKDVFVLLCEKGDEGIWEELERRYFDMFEPSKDLVDA